MSEEEFLRLQVEVGLAYLRLSGHDDTCPECRKERLGVQVAQEMLDRGDTGEGADLRWAKEFTRRLLQLPSMN